MKVYKLAQSNSQTLNLNRKEFGSVLRKSEALIKELNLDDVLSDFAEEKGYEDPIDYVICSLYPELEKECRDYYNNSNKGLKDLHPKKYIQKMDEMVSRALSVFNNEYQKMLKEQNESI